MESDSQEKQEFVLQSFLTQLDKVNQDSNEKIDFFFVSDKIFHSKYGINKFPQILFFRNGNYLIYNGNL